MLEFWLLPTDYCDHPITAVALSVVVQVYIGGVCFLLLSVHKLAFHQVCFADEQGHWHI